MEVKVGDKVCMEIFWTEVTLDGEEVLIMRESDVFAIMQVIESNEKPKFKGVLILWEQR